MSKSRQSLCIAKKTKQQQPPPLPKTPKKQKHPPLKTTIRTFKETDCTALEKYYIFVFIHCFRRLQAIMLVGNKIIHINVSRLFRKVICGSVEGGITLLFVENY